MKLNIPCQIFLRRISQSEIRNSASAKSEGGQKFFPPNPLPFCPPERLVSAVPPTAGAISRSFVPSVALWALAGRQKRFELRSAIATNQDISNFQGKEFARSPRRSLSRTAMRERVSLRKKPCISELNQRGEQIQIQFFGKANGGSACEARNKQSLFPIFSFPPLAGYKASFSCLTAGR